MYEDYLEEFIFKTAKLIAKKLFGRNTDDENEEAVEDPSTNPSDDLITNVNTESEEVAEENSPNVEQSNEEAKNDEPDENEFEILEKQQKPSDDACVEKVDDPDYGENLQIFKKIFFLCLQDADYRSRGGEGTRKINSGNERKIFKNRTG